MTITSRAILKSALAAAALLAAAPSQAELYWRFETGYSIASDANIRDKNFDLDGFICGDFACNTSAELNDIGSSALFGAGIGWRFSPSFRTDLMFGYRGWYELDDSDAFPSFFRADISSWSVLLNGYWDFNLGWGQPKPYVGAGIGYASNKIESIVNGGGALGVDTFALPGGTTSDMAWALMAGIAVPLSPGLTMDIGYRYIDLGKIESDSGAVSCAPIPCPGATYSGLSGNLRAHEFTIGLRF